MIAADGLRLTEQALSRAIFETTAIETASEAAASTQLTGVGRRMSREECDKMISTERVLGNSEDVSFVAWPASRAAFERQTSQGSYYVEFDIPMSSLRPDGSEGRRIIHDPNSLLGRLARATGRPIPEFPTASNIAWAGRK